MRATNFRTRTFSQKTLRCLPKPLQRFVAALLAIAQDHKSEVTSTQQSANIQNTNDWGWLPLLTLTCTLGTLSVSYAYTSARLNKPESFFFWFGLLLIFVPSALRLLSPVASRFERLCLLCIAGLCFYLVAVNSSPLYFSSYDEFLHWRTADDILRTRHLFNNNPILPVSPFYPGLEIVTNAVSSLSGLSTFYASHIVLAVARLVMIISLFLLYERAMESTRMAGIATLLYMTNPHFLLFDAKFGYESLALPLAIFALFALARQDKTTSENRWMMIAGWISLATVTLTHHMTAFVVVGLFILWTAIYAQQNVSITLKSKLALTTLFGVIVTVMDVLFIGAPVTQYLISYFSSTLVELERIFAGAEGGRQLFTVYSGQEAPIWERLTTFLSVMLILLGLPLGLLCAWNRYHKSALISMFCIASLFYPISHIFRFTNAGSEITDRAAAFLFIPLSCILAIVIVQLWPVRNLTRIHTTLVTCIVTIVFLGGVILGVGAPWEVLPGPYLISADERSIEPEGIQASLWAYAQLGANNRVGTDRINRILMATYGDQDVISTLKDGSSIAPIFFATSLGPDEIDMLKSTHLRYLVVDSRLAQGPPNLGFYFEPGDQGSSPHVTAIPQQSLTKFNTVIQISRIFDSGNIAIYDVRGIENAP